jgi:hypothetical protein
MKFKENRSFVYLPEYDYEVEIVFTTDIIQSRNKDTEAIGSTFNPKREVGALHSTAEGFKFSKLYFNYKPSPGIVAHECWHCVYNLFDLIGAEFENECVAYLLGYLVDSVFNFSVKLDKKRK